MCEQFALTYSASFGGLQQCLHKHGRAEPWQLYLIVYMVFEDDNNILLQDFFKLRNLDFGKLQMSPRVLGWNSHEIS